MFVWIPHDCLSIRYEKFLQCNEFQCVAPQPKAQAQEREPKRPRGAKVPWTAGPEELVKIRPPTRPHDGWTPEETDTLQKIVSRDGIPSTRSAWEDLAAEYNRSVSSRRRTTEEDNVLVMVTLRDGAPTGSQTGLNDFAAKFNEASGCCKRTANSLQSQYYKLKKLGRFTERASATRPGPSRLPPSPSRFGPGPSRLAARRPPVPAFSHESVAAVGVSGGPSVKSPAVPP